MPDLSTLQGRVEPGKGFLLYIVDRFPRSQARAQLQLNECAEVRAEMFPGLGVSGLKKAEVALIKRLKLQELAPARLKRHTV